jgi:hypothetical protein
MLKTRQVQKVVVAQLVQEERAEEVGSALLLSMTFRTGSLTSLVVL